MARYINLDALCEILDDDIKTGDERVTISWVKSWLLAQSKIIVPDSADVAPKSEVEREIFEEIENVINNELQNNCKVLPQFEFSNELWNKVSGRIEALKEICDFIVELKKKYIPEECPDCKYFVGCEKANWARGCEDFKH